LNYFLKSVLKKITRKNERFKGLHTGEICYIIGNGCSIKNMDLSIFSDHPAISLNYLCLHKDFKRLNILYNVLIEPLFFYPYFLNPRVGKIQPNVMGGLYKKHLKKFHSIENFVSLTNYFGVTGSNINYLYHFGRKKLDIQFSDIASEFSFMSGALHAAIGLAINMGFSKAFLLGMDYMHNPHKTGHFYSYGQGIEYKNINSMDLYRELFDEVGDLIELQLITDGPETGIIKSISYEEFTGKKCVYQENSEIISSEDLMNLQKGLDLHFFDTTTQIYGNGCTRPESCKAGWCSAIRRTRFRGGRQRQEVC
jgi:hypothetical protein